MADNKIFIFDTTLRDGEQVPGCKLNTSEKLDLALELENLGVDIIEAGLPIPDTTGYCLPQQYGEKIAYLVNHVSNVDKAVLSCHCHNDLGLATANSISGVISGARQIECTINGLGERAGNTSLEEVVMILKQHHALGYHTNIKPQKLNPISKLVSDTMRMPVQ